MHLNSAKYAIDVYLKMPVGIVYNVYKRNCIYLMSLSTYI